MNKPVSILILDNTFTFGGAINSLCHLLRAMDRERFAPVLVSGQPKKYLAENFDCLWYHSVPKLPWVNNRVYVRISAIWVFHFIPLLKILNLLRFLYWIAFVTVPEALRYYRLGRKHGVALVHLNNILGSQLAGIIAAKILRVPCIAHLRDFEEVHPVTRFYARLIDHHIAISRAIQDNLRQLGVPDDRISLVHDAIDLDEFSHSVESNSLLSEFDLLPAQPRFGIFGRVVDWKGVREFILAVRQVINDVPEARAFVVGGCSDGDEAYSQAMQQFAMDLGLKDKLVFTGYRRDVPAMMGLMDVVVHASTRPEPFGMVLIEGMAMKKPVVATRGGGPLDIVQHGVTGFLVEMGDSKALGTAVAALLENPGLREKMGLAGRARVEHCFSHRQSADQMEKIFQQLAVSS